jgi:hypothetical protein
MFFACTAAGKRYELTKLTLGQARTLKREFDLADIEDLNPTDPDQLVGLIYLALIQAGSSPEAALAEAEGIDIVTLEESAAEVEPDPTSAVAAPVVAVAAGNSETTPPTSGIPG